MAREEITGTGHQYTYLNDHPFAVGECGMPDADVGMPTVQRSCRGPQLSTGGRSDTCPRL